MAMPRLLLLLALIGITGSARTAENFLNYSPFETRDQNLFNLVHGQALPTNARLINSGKSLFSSSLSITNTINSETLNTTGNKENIYLDYEAYRLNLSYQYAINNDWNLKLDVPVIYQSGGIFDSAIDKWHQFWGLPRANRPFVENNQYDVSYNFQSQASINLNESSTTLGDIQLAAATTLIKSSDTTMSLWAALKLPTGDKNKLSGNGATDVSAWLALNQRLSENWLINTNAGLVLPGKNSYQSIPLSNSVVYGHIMLAWLVTESINLKVQLQGHTSYYRDSQLNLLGDTYLLTFGGAYNINRCQQLDFAFSEDIKVEASPDASMLISWRSFIGSC